MAILTESIGTKLLHGVVEVAAVAKTGQNDTVLFDKFPGIIPLHINNLAGTADTFTYQTIQVNNAGPAYTATTKSIVYDNATANLRTSGGYYVLSAGGEIMYVVSDTGFTATSGTINVIRGCLGTTATSTGIADDNYLYVLNAITLTGSGTGTTIISFIALPNEYKADVF